MKDQLVQRLAALKSEFEAGQKMLAELESQRVELKTTLTRISGAVQVLEEELAKAAAALSSAATLGGPETSAPAQLNGAGS